MGSLVTSWSFDSMDWANPISSHAVYIEAVCQAILEKKFILRQSMPPLLLRPRYPERIFLIRDYSTLVVIHDNVMALIPYFVNHTDSGGVWQGQESIPMWTRDSLLTALGADRMYYPQRNVMRNDEWIKLMHDILNSLKWTLKDSDISVTYTNYFKSAQAIVTCVSASEQLWTYARCSKQRTNYVDVSNWSQSPYTIGDLNGDTWDNSTSFWNIYGTGFNAISLVEVKSGFNASAYLESVGSGILVITKIYKRIHRARPEKFFWQEGEDRIQMEQTYSKMRMSFTPDFNCTGDVYVYYDEDYESPVGTKNFDPDKYHLLPYIRLNRLVSESMTKDVEWSKEDEYKEEVPYVGDPTLGGATLPYRSGPGGISGGGSSPPWGYSFEATTGSSTSKGAGNITRGQIVLKHNFAFN